MRTEPKRPTRCAIYTRKSSEEGLEQPFSSLDAQREACQAYIASQRHEGWQTINSCYDDGGFSGGTINRPALQTLLDDIGEQKIDAVVVYKVDRLTRSLADFAKIIEIFDKHKVSFVSITQQFNTTTSMGRLTLNVLLSFAQFEREVTGERIRDKIAASKRKGMWMGGRVPLGYDVRDRKLVVNIEESERVRTIYRQYLRFGCVFKLKCHLDRSGIYSKERTGRSGQPSGGLSYSRGALYRILQNRVYLGETMHRGQVYPGEHEGIVPRKLWEKVQSRLAVNKQGERTGSPFPAPSLLRGLVFDGEGNRFTPSHTIKRGKRYGYYVSQEAIQNPRTSHFGLVRMPARELDNLVVRTLRDILSSPIKLIDVLGISEESATTIETVIDTAAVIIAKLSSAVTAEQRYVLEALTSRIVVRHRELEIVVDRVRFKSELFGTARAQQQTENRFHSIKIEVHPARLRRGSRLILEGASRQQAQTPTMSLVKAIARAHDWYERIVAGELSGNRTISKVTGLSDRYISRILHCAFLAPDIVDSILNGTQPAALTLNDLIGLSMEWCSQRHRLERPSA